MLKTDKKFICISFQSTHQVGMKNIVKCYKHFFGYFNALKTHGGWNPDDAPVKQSCIHGLQFLTDALVDLAGRHTKKEIYLAHTDWNSEFSWENRFWCCNVKIRCFNVLVAFYGIKILGEISKAKKGHSKVSKGKIKIDHHSLYMILVIFFKIRCFHVLVALLGIKLLKKNIKG